MTEDRISEWDELLLLEEWEASVPPQYRAHDIYPGTWTERIYRKPNPHEGAIVMPWDGGTAYPLQRPVHGLAA
jgi:hypothetical protein